MILFPELHLSEYFLHSINMISSCLKSEIKFLCYSLVYKNLCSAAGQGQYRMSIERYAVMKCDINVALIVFISFWGTKVILSPWLKIVTVN